MAVLPLEVVLLSVLRPLYHTSSSCASYGTCGIPSDPPPAPPAIVAPATLPPQGLPLGPEATIKAKWGRIKQESGTIRG
jgi:hypothetical protein